MLNGNERIIKYKVGLLNLAEELGNVSRTCKVMGVSRDTFYRYKDAVDKGGFEALIEKDRRQPNSRNRVDLTAHSQVRARNELRKLGTFISPSGVCSVWLRHDLSCFKDRLKALEKKVADEGIILTEAQVQTLERKKHDDEIETHHPGYLGSQDTFYVDSMKGGAVGFISKLLSAPKPRSRLRSSIQPRRRSRLPTCSTTRSFRSLWTRNFLCCLF